MAEEKKPKGTAKKDAPAAKKPAAKKPAAKKTAASPKAESKAGAAKKPAAKKPAAKKPAAKKAAAKKPATKKDAADSTKAKPKAKPAAEKPKLPPPVVRPRKARLSADQVRGLHIDKARALLQFSPRGAAGDIAKVVNSAASNAENNHELIADDMKIMEITVDEGPTLRRYRPRALGRATPINKRTSHISVALTPEEDS